MHFSSPRPFSPLASGGVFVRATRLDVGRYRRILGALCRFCHRVAHAVVGRPRRRNRLRSMPFDGILRDCDPLRSAAHTPSFRSAAVRIDGAFLSEHVLFFTTNALRAFAPAFTFLWLELYRRKAGGGEALRSEAELGS